MLQLFLISSVFAFLGYWKPRAWALVVPFVVWLAIARLGDLGILPATTTTDSAISAGVVGAAFALLGFLLASGKPRQAPPAPSPTARRGEASASGVGDAGGTAPNEAALTGAPRTSRRKSTKAG